MGKHTEGTFADKRLTPVPTSRLGMAVSLLPLALLAGCAAFPAMDTKTMRPNLQGEASTQEEVLVSGLGQRAEGGDSNDRKLLTIPGPPAPPASTRLPATADQIAALVPDEVVDANLSPQSIPQFAATVFGGVLQLPFNLTSDVSTRSEVVAGGSGGPISKRQLFALTQQALRQYGIEVYIDGSLVTIGSAPQNSTGISVERSSTPTSSSGRVVQFYTAQSIEVNPLKGLLADLYPGLSGVRITPDQLNNSLIISGSGREVAQAVRALRELDQPRFAGSQVLRVEPTYWATDALATALDQVMTAEGYVVSRQAPAGRALVILSFPQANQLLIFAKDQEILNRASYWLDTMDQPAALGDKTSNFVYQVRNTDAASLGQLVMGHSPAGQQARPPVGVPGTSPSQGQTGMANANTASTMNMNSGGGGQYLNGRILTDPTGNRIIFTGTASDYAQLRSLLSTLDTPAPQVVIEVIIAEVTLSDTTSLGVQLFGTEMRGDGPLVGSTEGIGIGAGGLLMTFTGSDWRARLNAQAGNNRVNILQRPQLVARSGGTARFQVGSDVPIITSQRATNTQTGSTGTDVLQSVQYRQTGVILDLQPVVYGDRVDITISQEISEVGESSNPQIASPPILNRSLTTQIAISDGWTGILGGLISNNYSKINTGVPFIKDIPLIGSAFQNNSVRGSRTELLILLTPHVIRGDEDMAQFADRYTRDMNAAFRTGRGWSYTLTPFNVGFGIRGIGFDLPSANRRSDRELSAAKPDESAEASVAELN